MTKYQNVPRCTEMYRDVPKPTDSVDILTGRCWHCHNEDVELDVDTAECDNCVEKYAKEQEMSEK